MVSRRVDALLVVYLRPSGDRWLRASGQTSEDVPMEPFVPHATAFVRLGDHLSRSASKSTTEPACENTWCLPYTTLSADR